MAEEHEGGYGELAEHANLPQEEIKGALPDVKDAWFQDFLTGNLMWPRELTPGVSIFTTAALLDDPGLNWDSFYRSQLSADQIQTLSDVMDFEHEKANATRYTKDYQRRETLPPLTDDERGPVITSSHNHAIWQGNKKYVIEQTLALLDPDHQPRDPAKITDDEVARDIARLDALWRDQNPQNVEIVTKAKSTAQIAKNALLEKAPRGWSYLYRMTAAKKMGEKQRAQYDKFTGTYRDDLTSTGPINLTDHRAVGQACLSLARTHVNSKITAAMKPTSNK